MKKELKFMSLLFIIYMAVTLFLSFRYGLYSKESFYEGFLINLHNSAIDFLFISIVLFAFSERNREKLDIKKYEDNIDDCRFWFSEEAAFKIAANIRKLQLSGITNFDLSKCMLDSIKIKNLNMENTKFMGASIRNVNLSNSSFKFSDFHGANMESGIFRNCIFDSSSMKNIKCNDSNFQGAHMENVNFKKALLINSCFKNAIFKNSDFNEVTYVGSNFEQANFIGAININIDQLLKCDTLRYAKFDHEIVEQIMAKKPELLKEKPTEPKTQ